MIIVFGRDVFLFVCCCVGFSNTEKNNNKLAILNSDRWRFNHKCFTIITNVLSYTTTAHTLSLLIRATIPLYGNDTLVNERYKSFSCPLLLCWRIQCQVKVPVMCVIVYEQVCCEEIILHSLVNSFKDGSVGAHCKVFLKILSGIFSNLPIALYIASSFLLLMGCYPDKSFHTVATMAQPLSTITIIHKPSAPNEMF
jgi:hypothetical protein